MDCNETRRLLDAAIDGELSLERQLELERHLAQCPACAAFADAARARKTALREVLPRFGAPTALATRIRAAVRAESDAAPGTSISPAAEPAGANVLPFPARTKVPARHVIFWQATGLAASVMLALAVGYTWGGARAQASRLVDSAIADHVRSMQVDHLFDVVSTDQHTVKPWFAGKLPFSPPVVDLAAIGFPLGGGRLEHLENQNVAALVYHRRQHVINLFVWPAGGAPLPKPGAARDGYQVAAWQARDLNFLAVSEIPDAELEQFAAAFRKAAN